jgi:hypothetical protein
MRYANGQYMHLYWEEDDHPEYVRGHVTEQEARSALEEWYGECDWPIQLRHLYGRFVFSNSTDFDRELKVYDEKQRGAFALTEVRPNACASTRR